MGEYFLLDTDVAIEILRGKSSASAKALADRAGFVGISTISTCELDFGAERSRDTQAERFAIMMLTGVVEVLPFDEQASMSAGRLRALLAQNGTPIGHFDTLIAGHALALGLTLVTRNVKHFSQVPGLKIANWSAPHGYSPQAEALPSEAEALDAPSGR